MYGKSNPSSEILAKMDRNNFLIFCYPRTEAYRKFFKRYAENCK